MSMPENQDSYIEKKGMFYKCNLCNLFLNSLVQVRSHTSGNNHRLKVANAVLMPNVGNNDPVSIETLSLASTNSMTKGSSGMDSFIQMKGSVHECTICHVTLNSDCQVMDHISGTKHTKAKSSYTGETVSKNNFEMNNELDRALKNVSNFGKINTIKLIKANEPIII